MIYECSQEYEDAVISIERALECLQGENDGVNKEENLKKCARKREEIKRKKRVFDGEKKRIYRPLLERKKVEKMEVNMKREKLGICGRVRRYVHGKVASVLSVLQQAQDYQKKNL